MKKRQAADSCTTLLVGRKASFDGSTLIARTEDSQSGQFTPKIFKWVSDKEQPRHYQSVLSTFSIDLPDNPIPYTSLPDALGTDGIWAEAGINRINVGMSATETITTNPRVLGVDPLVESGIGEEDMLTLVLPYIQSAKEGVLRLGKLLKEFGTYESNGIAFSDVNEIWWMETVGGHHWIARRVPDDSYVVNPNQLGIDHFEFNNPDDYLCSEDLKEFIDDNNLDLTYSNEHFNPRYAFGSQKDKDKVYNTPRAWIVQKFLNPEIVQEPTSFFHSWAQKPYRKITVEDIKYLLSHHYQGTPFDPYGHVKDSSLQGKFRTIGINRTSQTSLLQIRSNRPFESTGIQWIAYGSMPFTTMVPFFTHITETPNYLSNTTEKVSTDNFYWSSRLIAGLADSHLAYHESSIDDYIQETMAHGHAMIARVDKALKAKEKVDFNKENQEMCDFLEKKTQELLQKILFDESNLMTNRYSVSD